MPNKKTEYSIQYLKNLSADFTVSPPIPREGILGKASDGSWYNLAVNPDGTLTIYYQKYVEDVDENNTYIGQSLPGTLETEAGWQIRKEFVDSGIIKTLYADNTVLFDKVWDDRATYAYELVAPSGTGIGYWTIGTDFTIS